MWRISTSTSGRTLRPVPFSYSVALYTEVRSGRCSDQAMRLVLLRSVPDLVVDDEAKPGSEKDELRHILSTILVPNEDERDSQSS